MKELIKQLAPSLNSLLTEIYADLAKPAVSEVGKALGTVFGLGNTILIPLTLVNEKSKIILQNNLENYREKIAQKAPEAIQEVVPEIGVPILEKLMYVTDENLVNLYTELLANASDKNLCSKAHPSFVNIINNLSPKEALMLKELSFCDTKAFINVNIVGEKNTHPYRLILSEFHSDTNEYGSNQEIDAFLSNISSLGLIIIDSLTELNNKERYESLYSYFLNNDERINFFDLADVSEHKNSPLLKGKMIESIRNRNFNYKRGRIRISPFGKLFIEACISIN